MPFSKKFVSTLLLPLLVSLAFYCAYLINQSLPKKAPLQVLGATSGVTLYEQPQSGKQPIIDAIKSAKKEVLVEVYILSDQDVIDALKQAKLNGVDIKVMLEQHPFAGGNLNPKTKQELDAAGVKTQWSNPAFALTHEKAIVIDSSEVFILSQNLSSTSFSKNREHDAWDTNPQDAQQVEEIFNSDWDRKTYTPLKTSGIIESPDNSRDVLTTLVKTAQKSVDAEAEDIADPQLEDALCLTAKTANVRYLSPTISQISSNKDSLTKLKDCGIKVKTISSPYMHAKMILADGNKAYVGSINFSTQSMDKNRELGIILMQQQALQSLSQDFESDWANADTY